MEHLRDSSAIARLVKVAIQTFENSKRRFRGLRPISATLRQSYYAIKVHWGLKRSAFSNGIFWKKAG